MTAFPLHPDTPIPDDVYDALVTTPDWDRLQALLVRDPDAIPAPPVDADALAPSPLPDGADAVAEAPMPDRPAHHKHSSANREFMHGEEARSNVVREITTTNGIRVVNDSKLSG